MGQLDMDRFDQDLRNALERKSPSPGFEGRLTARLGQQEHRTRWWTAWRRPPLRWAAITVVSLLLLVGVEEWNERQKELEQGQLAKDQVMLALRIAGSKIRLAQSKVQDLSQK